VGTPVTFNGLSVVVPSNGDQGWGNDVSALLIELANNAAVISALVQNIRVANATPVTILNTDYAVGVDVPSASQVDLPPGVASIGQLFIVYDASGSASSNPITITPFGSDTINGAASYVLATDRGVVTLQYDSFTWVVVSQVSGFMPNPFYGSQPGNRSYVSAAAVGLNFPTVSDGQQSTVQLSGTSSYELVVSLGTGQSISLHTSFASAEVTAVSDPSGLFLPTDAGVGIYVFKSAGSGFIGFKNRMGASVTIEVKSLTARVVGTSSWS
jgi:hypothetical protein